MKTIEEQIKCVEREIVMRKNFYAKRVTEGRMKSETAKHEIECMEAVLQTLKSQPQYVPICKG